VHGDSVDGATDDELALAGPREIRSRVVDCDRHFLIEDVEPVADRLVERVAR
jgi:hypothetical protein